MLLRGSRTTLVAIAALATAPHVARGDCPEGCPNTCPDQAAVRSPAVQANFTLDKFWGTPMARCPSLRAFYELAYHDNTQPSYMSCQRSVKSPHSGGGGYKDLFSLHIIENTTAICDLEFNFTGVPGAFLGPCFDYALSLPSVQPLLLCPACLSTPADPFPGHCQCPARCHPSPGHWSGKRRPDLHDINNTVLDFAPPSPSAPDQYEWVLEFQCADNATEAGSIPSRHRLCRCRPYPPPLLLSELLTDAPWHPPCCAFPSTACCNPRQQPLCTALGHTMRTAAKAGTPSGIHFAAINFYHRDPLAGPAALPGMEAAARARGI
eukprot:gene1430-2778_t